MSEEKPTFKITDRRLFNVDGSPRDIAPEDAAAAVAMPDEVTSGASSVVEFPSSAASSATAAAAANSGVTAMPPPEPAASATDQFEDDNFANADGDPTSFVNLLMFIAQPAAAALGISDHPAAAGHDIDLPLAKHCIDLLGTLQEKTRRNLTNQEQQIFEGLLAELRMQFVAVTKPRTGPISSVPPRGFSGNDITGGGR